MALPFPEMVRDNISNLQRVEAIRGLEEVSGMLSDTLQALNGHIDYQRKIIIHSIPTLVISSITFLYQNSPKNICFFVFLQSRNTYEHIYMHFYLHMYMHFYKSNK